MVLKKKLKLRILIGMYIANSFNIRLLTLDDLDEWLKQC